MQTHGFWPSTRRPGEIARLRPCELRPSSPSLLESLPRLSARRSNSGRGRPARNIRAPAGKSRRPGLVFSPWVAGHEPPLVPSWSSGLRPAHPEERSKSWAPLRAAQQVRSRFERISLLLCCEHSPAGLPRATISDESRNQRRAVSMISEVKRRFQFDGGGACAGRWEENSVLAARD